MAFGIKPKNVQKLNLKDMKLLYTSDIHASRRHLFAMLAAAEDHAVDSIIIGGDIVPHYLPEIEARDILEAQAVYLKNIFLPALADFKYKRDVSFFLDLARLF